MQKEKPLGRMNKAELIEQIDDFTQGYIDAALWSSDGNSNPDRGGEPLNKKYSTQDITNTSLARMIADCKKFQADNEKALDLYYRVFKDRPAEYAGHDFWLTSRRHGTGFWDRYIQGKPEMNERMKPVLAALTEASHAYSEDSLYEYKGKVHLY